MFHKSLGECGAEQNEAEEIIEKLQKSPATNIILERNLWVKYSQLIENEKNTAMISVIIDEILEIGKFPHATIINQLIKKLAPYTTNFLMLLAIAKERKKN